MNVTNQATKKRLYNPPILEVQKWQVMTGISLPIGTNSLSDNPLTDFLTLEEQP